MTDEQRRHRVLAGISRSRLLTVLRRAPAAMGVQELAAAVDLHPNTAREHLDQLVGAGLVDRERSEPSGRGRPAFRYRAAVEAEDDGPSYRALAGALATELAAQADASEAALRAGERWGHALAGAPDEVGSPDGAVDRLVELLDAAGFAPEPAAAGQPIRLRRCPFAPLARERGDVVCGVHLGLMRGALREMAAPVDAVRLDPFVEPSLCLAHLDAAADG